MMEVDLRVEEYQSWWWVNEDGMSDLDIWTMYVCGVVWENAHVVRVWSRVRIERLRMETYILKAMEGRM